MHARYMSLLDVKNLLEEQLPDIYFFIESLDMDNVCEFLSYFNCKFQNEKLKIKVSIHHDVKEVKWNCAEKQTEVCWKLLVMGTKIKEENWKYQ